MSGHPTISAAVRAPEPARPGAAPLLGDPGLAFCRMAVESHRGRIELQNEPTTFRVLLPREFGA